MLGLVFGSSPQSVLACCCLYDTSACLRAAACTTQVLLLVRHKCLRACCLYDTTINYICIFASCSVEEHAHAREGTTAPNKP